MILDLKVKKPPVPSFTTMLLLMPLVFSGERIFAQTTDEPLFSTMDTDAIVSRVLGRAGLSGYEPPDANRDGKINVADVVKSILHNPPEDARQFIPRIDLSAPPDRQAAQVELSWEVHGIENPEEYAVFLRAHTPSVVTTGTLAVQPGLAPATGSVFYLQPGAGLGLEHDIWGIAVQAFALDGATSRGLARALLYADMPGEWAFEAQLIATTTTLTGSRTFGDVMASDMETLLLTDVPAMRLRVRRSIAGTGDEVTADLETMAVWRARSVRLYGWLTRPDGSELALPTLEPSLEPVFVGTIQDESHRLLRRSLGEYGQGRFVVHAAMYDETTSRLLSLVQAPVMVSDAPSTITGQVLALVGERPTPINGPSFTRARVRALDADELATVETHIDSSGTYRLNLPPGRYLLSAAVRDGWTKHETALVDPLSLEGGADQIRDFTLDRLTTTTGSIAQSVLVQSKPALARYALASAPLTRPRLFVMIERNYAGGNSPEGEAMVERQVDRLRERMPGVEIVTSDDVRELLRRAAELEANNQPNMHLIEEIATAQATRSTIVIDVRDHGDGFAGGDFFFQPKLFDIGGGTVTWRGPISWTDNADDVLGNIDQAMARDGAALEQEIIRRNPVPARPKVTLALSNQEVYGGSTVEVRVTLLDESNGQPVNGKTLTVIHRKGPDYRTVLETLTGTTGSSGPGEFTVRLHASADAEFCEVGAIFERDGQSWSATPKLYSVLQVGSGTALKIHDAPLSFARWEPGWLGKVAFRVEDALGNPISGVRVNTSGVNCRVEDDRPISDILGITRFDFYAGDQNGHAAVHAACVLPGDPTTIHRAVFKFQVVPDARIAISLTRPQSLQAAQANTIRLFSLPSDVEGVVPLYATVYKGEDALPAVPVTFQVAGAGSILGARSQTDPYGVSYVNYLPPEYQSGTAQIMAIAMVGDEITTAALDVDYDPGLVIHAWVPDFLDEAGEGWVVVRVGRAQAGGDPLWEGGVTIDISATGGTALSPSGQTNADGYFESELRLGDGSERILINVQALAQDGRSATQQVVAAGEGRARLTSDFIMNNGSFGVAPNWWEEHLLAVSGRLESRKRLTDYHYWDSWSESRVRAGRIRFKVGGIARAYHEGYDAPWIDGRGSVSAKDAILINDPAKTSQIGTGRVFIHNRWSHHTGANWDEETYEIYHNCQCRSTFSFDVRTDRFMEGGEAAREYLLRLARHMEYKVATGTVNEPIGTQTHPDAETPIIAPFRFVYGEPFDLRINAFTYYYFFITYPYHSYGYQSIPYMEAAAGSEVDCMIYLIPDNPEATVITESGYGY